MRLRRRALACIILALSTAAHAEDATDTLASPESAAAMPDVAESGDTETDAPVEAARAAFQRGTTLARQELWVDALEAFRESAMLRPHPVTLYNIAFSERALAHFTRASKFFEDAIAAHEHGRWGRMRESMLAATRRYLVELEGKFVRARVTISPEDASVAIDGRPLERLAATGGVPIFRAGTRDLGPAERPGVGSFEVLLDPGHHASVVTYDGRTVTVDRVAVHGETLHVSLVVPERAPVPTSLPASTDVATDPPPAPDRSNSWTASYVAYGVGVAGLVTGAAFGVATLAKRSDLDDLCGSPPRCPPEAGGDVDTARRFATISDVAFGVGALGILIGTYFLLTSDAVVGHNARASMRARGDGVMVQASTPFGLFGTEVAF